MTATTDRCPGCGGSGMEPTGVTYAGMSEYVGCHECGPECPDDCGCRASDATERPESIARHPTPRRQAMTEPPIARYRLTLTIKGNTLDEIERELVTQTRGGFLLDSNYGTRHSWNSTDGTVTSVMEQRNPEMTPERYAAELHAWWTARKAERKADTNG